jgi:hypothetical protein
LEIDVTSSNSNAGLPGADQAALYLELWKQTVDVQKHFNDIELRIRGLALTVLTFILGGASLAIRDGTTVTLASYQIDLGSIILVLGFFLWLSFYFVDQIWYHRLLIGAVIHGSALESELRRWLPAAGLTDQISKSSPYEMKLGVWKISRRVELHSSDKIKVFYFFIATLLLVLAVGVQFGLGSTHPASKSSPAHGPSAASVGVELVLRVT